MQINLSKEQYRILLDLVYIGNWVVNAHRLFPNGNTNKDNVRIKKYDDVESYIFSLAEKVQLGDLVEQIDGLPGYHPTQKFESGEVTKLIDEYDEATFWLNLVDKLAYRDLIREYGIEKVRKMDVFEMMRKLEPFLDKYSNEISEYGVDRLEIVGDDE